MDTFDGRKYTDWHQMVRDMRIWMSERIADESCDTVTLMLSSVTHMLPRYRFRDYLHVMDEIIETFDPPGGMLDGPPPNPV